MRLLSNVVTVLFLLAVPPLWANEPLTYDRVSFSVSASDEVENDTLVVQMYAQREGGNAGELAQEVNRLVAQAMTQAKTVPAVKAQTREYSTSPIYRERAITGWRVRQGISLESQDAAALSKLIGALQERLVIGRIGYTLSPALKEQMDEQLTARAIAQFNWRAALISREMGGSGYHLVAMNINTSGNQPRIRAMAMADESRALKSATPPTLEAGTQRVEVRIDGTIELNMVR
ncbi:MAG: SIMPL domain-containing protein [Gammaproteobacteria bacterium]|nr:SIMPL domain-containing protein [Gammaproteobacteria bacterium]